MDPASPACRVWRVTTVSVRFVPRLGSVQMSSATAAAHTPTPTNRGPAGSGIDDHAIHTGLIM